MSTMRKPSAVDSMRKASQGSRVSKITHLADDLAGSPTTRLPRPEKPVRLTVDLTPAVHRALRDFAADTGPGVSAAETLRAMIAVTVADKDIAAEVRDHIRQTRS